MSGEDLPRVNACLNTLSALLLIIGWSAIRNRRVALHKTCMLAALLVSTIFLGSYLYYHFAVKYGQPTKFAGPAGVRLVYYTILLTHTCLAIVVAPLALYTAHKGLTNQLTRHVRVARWTMPIWLYVSVTGVIVYLMLYQWYPAR